MTDIVQDELGGPKIVDRSAFQVEKRRQCAGDQY
jgi:hypothetical protein